MKCSALLKVTLAFLVIEGPVCGQSLEFVRAARVRELAPKQTLPPWTDWKKLADGMAFNLKHRGRIGFIFGTTCLFETLGTVDAAPMFAATGVIEKDVQRGQRTAREFGAMLAAQESITAFEAANFKKARELGTMHLAMSQAGFAKGMKWDENKRRPFNQQAYAMVLHTFSYRPLEILIQQGQVDLVTEREGIEGWMHLWSVLAHGMGLEAQELAPWDFETAKKRDKLLRAEQLLPSDGLLAQPILRAELARSKARLLKAKPQTIEEEARSVVAEALLRQVRLSQGLDGALGLTGEDAKQKMLSWEW